MKTGFRLGVLLLLGIPIAAHGCASAPKYDPAIAEVSWRSFERNSSATLATRTFGDYEKIQRAGRLDPSVKLVDGETMGMMKAVLDRYNFFDRAVEVDPESVRDRTSQIITFREGQRTLVLNYFDRPGGDTERAEWDQDFVKIKTGLLDVHRRTFSLTVAAPGSGSGGASDSRKPRR